MSLSPAQIAEFYLSWTESVRRSDANRATEIVIDNLSDLRSVSQNLSELQVEEFLSQSPSEPRTKLKLQQSLAYLRARGEKPSVQNLSDTGAVFVDVTDNDLELLRSKASLEPVEYEETDLNAFIRKVGQQGIQALSEWTDRAVNVEWRLELPNEISTFDAMVKTDSEGRLVCAIPADSEVGAGLATTVLHEVAGHAVHFNHLRRNQDLKRNFPHLLCLSLHTHESFFLEGVAQFLVLLALERGQGIEHAAELKARTYAWTLTMALAHRNLSQVVRGKISLEEAVEFHLKHDNTGRVTAPMIRRRYSDSLSDLFACKTTLNYYSSFKVMFPLVDAPADRLRTYVPELLSTYFVPEELAEFVREITFRSK